MRYRSLAEKIRKLEEKRALLELNHSNKPPTYREMLKERIKNDTEYKCYEYMLKPHRKNIEQ